MKEFPIDVPRETLDGINPGPYRFPNVHSYQILFRSDPELVASLVPEPLIAHPRGNMSLVVAQYHGGVETPIETLPGYNEIVLGAQAMYRRPDGREIKGLYMVQLYLADRAPQSAADPIVLGLAIPGYPKRICHWQEHVQENERHIRIARRGLDVLDLHVIDAPLAEVILPPVRGSSFVLKYVPSAVDDECADVLKLNRLKGTTQMTSMAQVAVRIGGEEIRLDTGVALPVREVHMATRCMMDMVPERNELLVDYLAERAPA